MPFRCPQCHRKDTLEIHDSIQLQADSRSDDILVQLVGCEQCGFQGLAVFEESRRGSWDTESWEHTGFQLAADELERIAAAIRNCPQPRRSDCGCPVHLALGHQDEGGRWDGLKHIQPLGSFQMHLT
jgi:hypothetical protein